MMDALAIGLLAIGALGVAANFVAVVQSWRGKRLVSVAPPIGGLAGAIGAVLHSAIPWYVAPVFLLLDVGGIAMASAAVMVLARRFGRRSS